jgi:hypothetical protein
VSSKVRTELARVQRASQLFQFGSDLDKEQRKNGWITAPFIGDFKAAAIFQRSGSNTGYDHLLRPQTGYQVSDLPLEQTQQF